jgi:hypothetical protein
MNPAQLINQTSGVVEYYTPGWITAAAREVMGSIDLDPASSAAANERVKARTYFTADDDGLRYSWYDNVWMNHPFGREGNPLWVRKLVAEYAAGRVKQACCITYACTSEAWFQPLLRFPICFIAKRVNYLLPDGTVKVGVTKGSCVAYLGEKVDRFAGVFGEFGNVLLPYRAAAAQTMAPAEPQLWLFEATR